MGNLYKRLLCRSDYLVLQLLFAGMTAFIFPVEYGFSFTATSTNKIGIELLLNDLSATVTSTNVSCNGANDGSITLSDPAGGIPPYEYSIDGGTSWHEDGSFTGLPPQYIQHTDSRF